MGIKYKAILICGTILLTGITPDVGYARWSSSSSSSSRSYSPKTYSSRSVTGSSYSGFGSKGYSSSSSAAPKSLTQNKSTNIFARQAQSNQTSKDYYNWKNNSTSNSSYSYSKPNPTIQTQPSKIVNKTYVTKNYNYGGHSYVMPSYYTPAYSSYGNLSSFFLGMLLAKATEPSYYNWAYAHYDDPSYIQWHREMEAQAQNNANLQSQLAMLDAKVEELKISNANPATLNKADPDLETGPEVKSIPVEDATPQKEKSSSYFSNIVVGLGSLILFVLIVVLILL